ncbi:MAG: hypothetical protein ACH346_07020 [Chthoniobacterales bacterium]
MKSIILSLLPRFSKLNHSTRIISCIALLFSFLLMEQASAQSTSTNPNLMLGGFLDLADGTLNVDSIVLMDSIVESGTINATSLVYCTALDTNASAANPSYDEINVKIQGTAALYISPNCIATLSIANTYTGGTIIDGSEVVITGEGTLGANNGALILTNGATLDLGGTTQIQQSVTPNDGSIMNGTIIATSTATITTYDANGNVVSPASAPAK